ncbi:MAG: enoyl-CoA hydratase/isomerase family protein [Pseudomonadota bacterium]
MSRDIKVERIGSTAHVVIDYPERRNALTLSMWGGIEHTLKALSEDEAVRAVIIQGKGAHFAAGADMSEFATHWDTEEKAHQAADQMARAKAAIEDCTKPVIAAIEGSCMGAGLSVATAADIRVGAKGAKFALPPAKIGASYPYSDLRRLVDLVGQGPARDLMLSARVMDANEAYKRGLVSRLVENGEALSVANALADEISELSPWALSAAKTMLNTIAMGESIEPDTMRALQVSGFSGAEFKEGYTAFLEKRKPDFKRSGSSE